MTNAGKADELLYMGIDGGGSKCRAVIVSSDLQILGKGVSGPANPLRGMDVATHSVLDATTQALYQAGLTEQDRSRLIVGAGLAGVNVPEYFQMFSAWQHPFKQFYLTHDLHIACIGAHQGQDGAVIICGTGSCGLAIVGSQQIAVGGHGFPYGDNGSGAWFGMQILHHVLLAQDKLGPQTLLTNLLLNASETDSTSALVTHFMHATPTLYARYAVLAFDAASAGDAVAKRIVQQGAGYIGDIARRLLTLEPPRLSLMGGLSGKLLPYLPSDIQGRITPVLQSPELGAIRFARESQKNETTQRISTV